MQLTHLPSIPPYLDIDLTNLCNVKCDFCSVSATNTKSKNEIGGKKWLNFFDSLKHLPLFKVSLLGGEPLLVPEIYKIIDCLSSQSVDTSISTNGWLLNHQNISKLISCGLTELQVSIDFPTAELHDASRQKKGLFLKAITGVKLAHELGLNCTINYILSNKSLRYLNEMYALAESIDVGIVLSEFKPVGGAKNLTSEILSFEDIANLPTSKYANLAPFFYDSVKKEKNYCAIGLDRLYISELGDIYPCDLFRGNHDKVLGNILKDNLIDVWLENDKLNEIRAYKYGSDVKAKSNICNDCGAFNNCRGGCLALADEHLSNHFSGDPRCSILKIDIVEV